MDFLVYSRDAPGSEALRGDRDLLEAHWSYMDAFADTMIARGPTLAADRETATGSLHVLGLPSVDAAREFVTREPNNRAGVYSEHFVWRFVNLLGRTMWEFAPAGDEPMFLIIARSERVPDSSPSFAPIPREELPADVRERLILYGALSGLEEGEPFGAALAVQAAGRAAAAALLGDGRTGLDVFRDVEVHDWEFGGRR